MGKKAFLEHPVSYVLLFFLLIPFAWQATAIMLSKFRAATTPPVKQQTTETSPLPKTHSADVPFLAAYPHRNDQGLIAPRKSSPAPAHAASTLPVPSQTVNAPNGIGMIGGTLINPQVNNFGYARKTLMPDQMSIMSSHMATIVNGKDRSDLITCEIGEEYSCLLAIQMSKVFHDAGWMLKGNGYSSVLQHDPPEPVEILVHSIAVEPGQPIKSFEGFPAGAKQLADDLKDAGIKVNFSVDSSIPAEEFRILIGTRP